MEASRLWGPPLALLLPSSRRSFRRKVRFFCRRRPHVGVLVAARKPEEDPRDPSGGGGGDSVDEGLPTLWKRIGDLRAADRGDVGVVGGGGGGDQMLPVELSRLERDDSCMFYQSEMLEVLALLQMQAEEERWKVAVGVSVTVKLHVPTSVLVVMLHLIDAAKVILNGVQQHQHK